MNLIETLQNEYETLIKERNGIEADINTLNKKLVVISERMTALDRVIQIYADTENVLTQPKPDDAPKTELVERDLNAAPNQDLIDNYLNAVPTQRRVQQNQNTEQSINHDQDVADKGYPNKQILIQKQIARPSRIVTPERTSMMLREYPIGTPSNKLLVMLNDLPGDKLRCLKDVSNYATRIGVKRDGSMVVRPPRSEPGIKSGDPFSRALENKILFDEYKKGTPEKDIFDIISHTQGCRPFDNVARMRQHARRIGAYQEKSQFCQDYIVKQEETKQPSDAPKPISNKKMDWPFKPVKPANSGNKKPTTKSQRWMPSQDDINRYIASKGVTKLPPAIVGETTAKLNPEDEKIIKAHNREMFKKRLNSMNNRKK